MLHGKRVERLIEAWSKSAHCLKGHLLYNIIYACLSTCISHNHWQSEGKMVDASTDVKLGAKRSGIYQRSVA